MHKANLLIIIPQYRSYRIITNVQIIQTSKCSTKSKFSYYQLFTVRVDLLFLEKIGN